jgi:hypothetical protein
MNEMAMMMAMTGGYAGLVLAPLFVIFGYLYLTFWDRRDDRVANRDRQLGSKLILWGFLIAAVSGLLVGANGLVSYVLSGFKGEASAVKAPLAAIVSNGAVVAVLGLVFLPRTNNAAQPQIERFGLGLLALGAGAVAIMGFTGLVAAVFEGASWREAIAPSLSMVVVFGAGAGFVLLRHGKLSGWSEPVRPAPPAAPPSYPPQGGYPQPGGGGYPPPQGGGYPPQGGGYPPQGGGYPPQGGGYGR